MESLEKFARRVGIRNYTLIKFAIDLALWTAAAPLAFLLHVEPAFVDQTGILVYTLIGIPIKAVMILVGRLTRQSWHKTGVRDLYKLVRIIGLGALALVAVTFIAQPVLIASSFPHSVPLLEAVFALLLLGGVRLARRLMKENTTGFLRTGPTKRVLIVGAGDAGTMIARELIRHPASGLDPVGYLDDDPIKQQKFFYGIPVLGKLDELPPITRRANIDEVLIALPSISGDVVRKVVKSARLAGVGHRTIPGLYDILSGNVSISSIREVDVEDLLRRKPVMLNMKQIADYLEGRTVLVTGACGSIGSELVRQIVPFYPELIILVDREENNLYLFERELRDEHPSLNYVTEVLDIQRAEKLERVFQQYQPEVVFHAAAYKHVPIMETHPDEAILNNVGGTRNLLNMAAKYGVKRFVNISTDKAIRPTSIMGASKRIAEYLVEHAAHNAKNGSSFVSVRFGNVLGSRGSVVPIFKDQIRHGGPVTVTHPDMTRYFMSIPEASQLVLQAAGLGDNGALYILDMGEPVKILDLARDLIELSGLEPEIDIPIEITGLRPGEKLFEELLTDEENTTATKHEKIYCTNITGVPSGQFEKIDDLLTAARNGDEKRIRALLHELIPSYQPHKFNRLHYVQEVESLKQSPEENVRS